MAAPSPQAAGELTGRDLDLVRVLEAQGEWNEHTRQSLAALVECIRTLRDDWADGAGAPAPGDGSAVCARRSKLRTTRLPSPGKAVGCHVDTAPRRERASGAAPVSVSRSTEGDGGHEGCRRHRGDEIR